MVHTCKVSTNTEERIRWKGFTFSSCQVEIRQHTEFQLPVVPVSDPKVCVGGWVASVC